MSIILHGKISDPGREVSARLTDVLEKAGEAPVLLLLSGEVCFDVIQHLNVKHLPKHLTITTLDERMDGKNSIFGQLTDKLFYKQARDKGVVFVDIRPQDKSETLETVAARLNTLLHTWKTEHPDGITISVQDMGLDGRIAGIVGKTMKTGEFLGAFEDRTVWAVGYTMLPTQNEHLERVTATLSFMRHGIDHAFVIVNTKDGIAALNTLLKGHGYLSDFPAMILHDMQNVEIFTNAHM